jgi:CRP/FNR family transcriptional regulator, cyclic AMP receptor protein
MLHRTMRRVLGPKNILDTSKQGNPVPLLELIGLAEPIGKAVGHVTRAIHTPTGIIAYTAVTVSIVLMVVSSFVKTMVPLRWLAVGSNVGLLIYGVLEPSLTTFVLEAILMPINFYRALEMRRLTRQVTEAATTGDVSGVWLKPYMKTRHLSAGHTLFKAGDEADNLYFLASGRIELVEIGESLEPGQIFGEIAFFSYEKRRTLTARCSEECTVMSINESNLKQLYYQNPKFGFELIGLVAGRLSADVRRLERNLTAVHNKI